ncbi:MAG: TetR family transcriptional regulator [Actinomycetota bacterium]|nr:TetR family transcriptional regulator [Actinomycetota bacterium]
MRSTTESPDVGESVDDRSTRARIRDAGITCIARHGIKETTARKVASIADVSPALVIHHFGSMDGLRSACDEFVATTIRDFKEKTLSTGPNLDVLAALRNAPNGPLIAYLAQVLADDSPAVARLVDGLVDDAEGYIQQGVDSGLLKPTDDPRGRAVVLTAWGLGSLVLHQHIERLLGFDLTDPDALTRPTAGAYIGPIYEIYGEGILEEPFATQVQQLFTESEGTT